MEANRYLCTQILPPVDCCTNSFAKLKQFFLLIICIAFFITCARRTVGEDPKVWQKIKIDFHLLDKDGLSGPPDGKTALNFEFCIPKDEKKWRELQKISPDLQKQIGGRGRIGCQADQWLIIGSTHQPQYKRILYELASLPYVARIEPVFWE